MSQKGSVGLVTRNFLSLGSGEVVARMMAFGATIFIAQTLGASSFGALQLAAAVVLYFSRVVDMGFELGLGAREVATGTIDPGRLASAATTIRSLIAVGCVAVLVTVGLNWLPEPEGDVLAIQAFTLLAVGISTRWLHLGFDRARLIAIARTVGEVLMVVLVLLTVRVPDDLLRVPAAQVAGDLLAAAVLLFGASRLVRIRPRLNWKLVAPLARRAIPLASSALFGLMIYNADLIFIRVFHDSQSVGFYAAAYALVSFLANLAVAYGLSVLPTLTRLASDRDEQRRLYHTVNTQAFLISLAIAVGGCLLAPGLIHLVFGSEYEPSISPLAIIIWAVPVLILQNIAVSALLSEGRETLVLKLTATAALVNLILNTALVPRWGIQGAAIATAVTETVRFALAVLAARPLGFTLPPLGRFVRPIAAATIMAAVIWPVRSSGLFIAIPLGTAAWVASLSLMGGLRWGSGTLPTLDI